MECSYCDSEVDEQGEYFDLHHKKAIGEGATNEYTFCSYKCLQNFNIVES